MKIPGNRKLGLPADFLINTSGEIKALKFGVPIGKNVFLVAGLQQSGSRYWPVHPFWDRYVT